MRHYLSKSFFWRCFWTLTWLFALAGGVGRGLASEEDYVAPSHELKAAFIYNFILFSKWPENVDRLKLKIGVINDKLLFEQLKLLENRSESNASYSFHYFNTIDDYQTVDMLWVGGYKIGALQEKLKGKPIIVIGEELTCWQQNLHICLIKQGNLFRFKIDLFSFQQSGLKISSKVIRLAKEIRN